MNFSPSRYALPAGLPVSRLRRTGSEDQFWHGCDDGGIALDCKSSTLETQKVRILPVPQFLNASGRAKSAYEVRKGGAPLKGGARVIPRIKGTPAQILAPRKRKKSVARCAFIQPCCGVREGAGKTGYSYPGNTRCQSWGPLYARGADGMQLRCIGLAQEAGVRPSRNCMGPRSCPPHQSWRPREAGAAAGRAREGAGILTMRRPSVVKSERAYCKRLPLHQMARKGSYASFLFGDKDAEGTPQGHRSFSKGRKPWYAAARTPNGSAERRGVQLLREQAGAVCPRSYAPISVVGGPHTSFFTPALASSSRIGEWDEKQEIDRWAGDSSATIPQRGCPERTGIGTGGRRRGRLDPHSSTCAGRQRRAEDVRRSRRLGLQLPNWQGAFGCFERRVEIGPRPGRAASLKVAGNRSPVRWPDLWGQVCNRGVKLSVKPIAVSHAGVTPGPHVSTMPGGQTVTDAGKSGSASRTHRANNLKEE